MVSLMIGDALISNPLFNKIQISNSERLSSISLKSRINCFEPQSSKFFTPLHFNKISLKPNSRNWLNSIDVPSKVAPLKQTNNSNNVRRRGDELVVGVGVGVGSKMGNTKEKMLVLCGLGYWVQGFRCFPWLALNFHMAQNLKFDPSTLQLVQYSGILPMVAKPLYGILSDALYIGSGHRIPYICIGVLLQVLSWGPLSLVPFVGEALPTLMACVLLSNLGAAITEVAQDALVAEYGQKYKLIGLQSYAFMAIAVAGILGKLISASVEQNSFLNTIKKQYSDLLLALTGDKISRPLIWAVGSIALVPMLTGSIFCYQMQYLNLDPSIIGISKVIGQMLLLSLTVLYDQIWKDIPMRKLISIVQILYAFSLLFDLALVGQINLKLGIPNHIFALCFSGLAETIATFKTVPFFVLIGSLCPSGCEGSVTAFLASALTLSTIVSGFFGIGLASVLGITRKGKEAGVGGVGGTGELGKCSIRTFHIVEKENLRHLDDIISGFHQIGKKNIEHIDFSLTVQRGVLLDLANKF
ncbi:putative folate-biopterin transporter 9 chloroplastic [Bienertia sinuspersici]